MEVLTNNTQTWNTYCCFLELQTHMNKILADFEGRRPKTRNTMTVPGIELNYRERLSQVLENAIYATRVK